MDEPPPWYIFAPSIEHTEGLTFQSKALVPQPRKVHRTFTYYGSLEDGLNVEPEVGAIGAPPGLDANVDYPTLRAIPKETDITVIDYSPDQFECHENIDNDSLSAFLERPRPEWSKVRWFNVNGLSWDVIQKICTLYSTSFPFRRIKACLLMGSRNSSADR